MVLRDPFKEFGFGDSPFKKLFLRPDFDFALRRSPVIDSFETNKEVVVTAELPGVRKEDVKVRVSDKGVSLSVESKQKHEEEKKDKHSYHYEYSSRFSGLSEFVGFKSGVKASEAKASFKNGVLEVRVPKKESASGEKGKELKIE
jgi:HSP20 family protein